MVSRRVQIATAASVTTKRFRPVRERSADAPRVQLDPTHRTMVLADLRRGCLDSLDGYLRKNRGIPDRFIAVELRKLLAGSPMRTRFRIIAIDHPNGPPPKKGRPKKRQGAPSKRQLELAHALRARAKLEPKVDIAARAVASAAGVSPATVYEAQAALNQYEARTAKSAADIAAISLKADRPIAALREASSKNVRK